MALKLNKRKVTPLPVKPTTIVEADSKPDAESDEEENVLFNSINSVNDSSDSEGENSDDEGSVLSFELSENDDSDAEDYYENSDEEEEDDDDDEEEINDESSDESDDNNDDAEVSDSDDAGEESNASSDNENATEANSSHVIEEKNEDDTLPLDNNILRVKKNNKKSTKKGAIADEYENDTSDEEDIRNTVGNIPMHWYDEYKHIGYDWDGKQIIKPPKHDQLDDFLKKMEDPDFWRTVKDPQTGQEVVLSEADIQLIKRINSRRIPDGNYNEYAPWIEWFSSEVEKMPIVDVPSSKKSFIPSKSERKMVGRIVHSIKMGYTKVKSEQDKLKSKVRMPNFYMLWETDTDREKMRRIHDHVVAPKRDLPGHAESYNPPPEYLFDDREMKVWEKLKDEPHKRKLHFLPQKYKSLREVPAYSRYLRERFLRCLDLYLCPRAKRMKLTIEPEYLIPKLPSPKDLQPFPTTESLVYRGHTDIIRCISMEPKGEYILTGSDDTTVKIWEISTARCLKTLKTDDVVRSVAWCPNSKLLLIAVATGQRLLLINPRVGDKLLIKNTDEILKEMPVSDVLESERIRSAVQWNTSEGSEYEMGTRIVINHFKEIKQVTWHSKGDYFATVMPDAANRSVIIHHLSKRKSLVPFAKSKGLTQCVLFHPIKPTLFVATQRHIRVYDLVKQEQIKKLLTNSKWVSGMTIHPKGDNLLVSTYDKKILWYDLDLSTKPYQTLRLHHGAVRNVAFHLRYPLFASASDDQSVIVSHGMVYNDLLQNALIVPLKKLKTHEKRGEFGVFDAMWHPTQPWVFSTGADCTVRLYT